MFNRRLSFIVALVMLVSFVFVGCGSQPASAPKTEPPKVDAAKTEAPKAEAPKVDKAAAAKEVAWEAFGKLAADQANNKLVVPAKDVKELITGKDDKYLVIDLRSAEDYAKEHVKGAVNIPFGKIAENLGKLPYDKTLVLYCYSGQTAGISTVPLKAAGYNVVSISKGFPEVKAGGFALDATAVELKTAEAKKFDEKTAAALEGIKEAFAALVIQNTGKTLIVDSKDVKNVVDGAPDKHLIVDLRKAEDFANGHVKGAINIPLGKLKNELSKLPKDKTIVVYCYSGQTSGMSLLPLKLEGYKLISISKGFPTVEAAKFTIEK